MQKTGKTRKGGRKPAFTVAPEADREEAAPAPREAPKPQTIRLNIGPKLTEAERAQQKLEKQRYEKEEANTLNVLFNGDLSTEESAERTLDLLPERTKEIAQTVFYAVPLNQFQDFIRGFLDQQTLSFVEYYRKWKRAYTPETAEDILRVKAFLETLNFKPSFEYNVRLKKFVEMDPEVKVRERLREAPDEDSELFEILQDRYSYFPAFRALIKGYLFAVKDRPMLSLESYEEEFRGSAEFAMLERRKDARLRATQTAREPEVPFAAPPAVVNVQIQKILGEAATEDVRKLGFTELYAVIVRVAGSENPVYTVSGKPTEYVDIVVNSMYDSLAAKHQPVTIAQFAYALSDLIVFLRASIGVISNDVFRSRVREGYYRPEILGSLSDAQKLPEIFENKTISAKTKEEIASHIEKLRQRFVKEFADSVNSMRNKYQSRALLPTEAPLEFDVEILKPSCANYDLEIVSGPFAGFDVKTAKAEDLVVYEENGLNYCFDSKQLKEYFKDARYGRYKPVNPYTNEVFDEEFVEGVKSNLQQKLLQSTEYKSNTVSYEEDGEIFYLDIPSLWKRLEEGDTTNPITGKTISEEWIQNFKNTFKRPAYMDIVIEEVEETQPLAPGLIDLLRRSIASLETAIPPPPSPSPPPSPYMSPLALTPVQVADTQQEKRINTELRPGLPRGEGFFKVLYEGMLIQGQDNPGLFEDFCEYLQESIQSQTLFEGDPCETLRKFEYMFRGLLAMYAPAQVETDIIQPLLNGASVQKIIDDNPGHVDAINAFVVSGNMADAETQIQLVSSIKESILCENLEDCAPIGEIELGVVKIIFDIYTFNIPADDIRRIQPYSVNKDRIPKDVVSLKVKFRIFKMHKQPQEYLRARGEYLTDKSPETLTKLRKEIKDQYVRDSGIVEEVQYVKRIEGSEYYKPADIDIFMVYNPETNNYIPFDEYANYISIVKKEIDGCGEECVSSSDNEVYEQDGCGDTTVTLDGKGGCDSPMEVEDGTADTVEVADGCGEGCASEVDASGNDDKHEYIDSDLDKDEINDTLNEYEEKDQELEINKNFEGVEIPQNTVCEICKTKVEKSALKTIIVKKGKPEVVYFCCFQCFEKYQ